MKRKYTAQMMTAVFLMSVGMLAGCGARNMETTTAESAAYDAAGDMYGNDGGIEELAVEESAAGFTAKGVSEGNSAQVEVQDVQRKLIRNVNLDVETENFDQLLVTITQKTAQAGGYVEQSYTYNGSSYDGDAPRNANLTLRVPAQALDDFLGAVAEVSNVISRNESISDVTLQYVDMESHKKALQLEQERLLELLEQAETVEDIITIESRLSQVRYQIESMESQLRTMDNQVSYSTVYLYITEVETYTPVVQQSAWQKISTGFIRSVRNIGQGFLDFGVWFVIHLPYLVLWAGILFVMVLVIKLIIRRGRKKKVTKKVDTVKPEEKQNISEEKKEDK